MKHRKFVKQLMALGYQRNDAEYLANGPDMMGPAPNQHLDGLSARITLADEWDSLPSDKIYDQAMSACAGGGGR